MRCLGYYRERQYNCKEFLKIKWLLYKFGKKVKERNSYALSNR